MKDGLATECHTQLLTATRPHMKPHSKNEGLE